MPSYLLIFGYSLAVSVAFTLGFILVERITGHFVSRNKPPEAQWGDPLVQKIYEILANSEDHPPEGEHWEGWCARRIVDLINAERVN